MADISTKGIILAELGVPTMQMTRESPYLEQLAPFYRWLIENPYKGEMAPHQEHVFVEDVFRFVPVFNTGASWGLAAGKTGFLLAGSSIALIFMLWLFLSLDRKQRIAQAAMGMIFAGALGNTHDRLLNTGRVVDYIEFDLHIPLADPWPAFNVADSLLCVGVAILMICMFRAPRTLGREDASPLTCPNKDSKQSADLST